MSTAFKTRAARWAGSRALFKQVTIPIPAEGADQMLKMQIGNALCEMGRSFQMYASMSNMPVGEVMSLAESRVRDAEAEPLYQRSLAIWEKALGPEHR